MTDQQEPTIIDSEGNETLVSALSDQGKELYMIMIDNTTEINKLRSKLVREEMAKELLSNKLQEEINKVKS